MVNSFGWSEATEMKMKGALCFLFWIGLPVGIIMIAGKHSCNPSANCQQIVTQYQLEGDCWPSLSSSFCALDTCGTDGFSFVVDASASDIIDDQMSDIREDYIESNCFADKACATATTALACITCEQDCFGAINILGIVLTPIAGISGLIIITWCAIDLDPKQKKPPKELREKVTEIEGSGEVKPAPTVVIVDNTASAFHEEDRNREQGNNNNNDDDEEEQDTRYNFHL